MGKLVEFARIMTHLLLIVSLLVWPFGQLLTFQASTYTPTIYLLDIITGLLAISLFTNSKSRSLVLKSHLSRPLVTFLIISAFSLVINYKMVMRPEGILAIFYFFRLLIYPSVFFAVKSFPPQKIKGVISLSITTFILITITQYLFFPDMRYLKLLGFDDHYYRAIGGFYDPNFTGAVLAAISLFLIASCHHLLALPAVTLLALTFSRASYLSFVMATIYLFVVKKKHINLAFLGVLITAIVLTPKPFGEGVNLWRTFSIFSRLASWQSGLELVRIKPLLGWGYNTLHLISGTRFQIDNSYIFIAATTGIIGLLSFFNLIKQSLSGLALENKVAIIVLLVHSMFNNSLFFIWIYYFFWLLLAIVKEYKPD